MSTASALGYSAANEVLINDTQSFLFPDVECRLDSKVLLVAHETC